MKNHINNKRYQIKEKIAFQTDSRYEEALDFKDTFTDKEMDELVESIVKNSDINDFDEPFNQSVIPLGKNDKKIKNLFYHKQYYRYRGYPQGAKPGSQNSLDGNAVDDQSKYQGTSRDIFTPFISLDMLHDKTFYGRIDTHNRPIYPSEKFLSLVNGTDDVMLLNFVCEALNEMIIKIDKMKETGKISKKSVFYNFKAKTGWKSFVQDHHKTMEAIFIAFTTKYVNDPKNSIRIRNFKDYTNEFMIFLHKFLLKFPITRSNLQLRKTTDPRISGIAFEISTLKHDDDESKYRKYILDKHFVQFQKILNAYGFMSDKNAPWRIIADLESPEMKRRMAERGYNTLQNMFDAYYYKTHLYEVNMLKKYFLSYYDSYIISYPNYFESYKSGDSTKTRVTRRKEREKDSFTDKKLLQFYYFIRAKEIHKDWSQEEFDLAFEESYQVYKHYGFIESLNHINDKTTVIFGLGANYGHRTKKEENYRIFNNHQTYRYRTFTIKI